MAALYGTIKGKAGKASRLGTYESGIRATVQSWHGSLIVEMTRKSSDDLPIVKLSINDSESSDIGTLVFMGTLDELKAKLGS